MSHNIIYQDNILNSSAKHTEKILEEMGLGDEHFEAIYNILIEVLNKILDNPEYKNYN